MIICSVVLYEFVVHQLTMQSIAVKPAAVVHFSVNCALCIHYFTV